MTHQRTYSEAVDTNGDGVPDVFERRPSITEILNARETDTVEVELEGPRPPKTGDVYIMGGEFVRAAADYPALPEFHYWIVRRFILGTPTIRDN